MGDINKPYPGFLVPIIGIRVSYISADIEKGWGHDEGDVAAREVFAISDLYEKLPVGYTGVPRRVGLRIVFGRHSLWFVR